MSFEIRRGLFGFDFTDYHAVIGISIDTPVKDIRKQYLHIARRLHPDVCRLENKELAQELLSKLINPAYAKLSNEREYTDYGVLLRMTGKRLLQESDRVQPQSTAAQTLMALESIEQVKKEYTQQTQALSATHFVDLEQALESIATFSELNEVYLLRREQHEQGWSAPAQPQSTKVTPAGRPAPPPPPPPPRTSTESLIDRYVQRAESLVNQGNFVNARKELQDALKLDAHSARCHALMAKVFLQQNEVKPASMNLTMAKTHLSQAVKLDAQDPIVMEVRKLYNKQQARPTTSQPTTGKPTGKPISKTPTKTTKKPDKGGGGLFGGLFGKKK